MKQHTLPPVRTYQRKIPVLWWTRRFSSVRFICRELTSLAVAFAAIELLLLVRAVSQGAEAYLGFLEAISSPGWIMLHAVVLLGLLFHSITWFNLAPKAMVVKVGRKRMAGTWIMAVNYLGWLLVSAVILLLIFRTP